MGNKTDYIAKAKAEGKSFTDTSVFNRVTSTPDSNTKASDGKLAGVNNHRGKRLVIESDGCEDSYTGEGGTKRD